MDSGALCPTPLPSPDGARLCSRPGAGDGTGRGTAERLSHRLSLAITTASAVTATPLPRNPPPAVLPGAPSGSRVQLCATGVPTSVTPTTLNRRCHSLCLGT
ncbi:hypothetical protein AAFF_G00345790 [Aldrovandia affinis]|uniref:Uncharacterized protein n=1 Tax=Aldrovandia affinis TaxID=143900 RepID=A0AAD7SJD6_9TELE|nr:hypothetical protein AAFF_G00345790 [Aldrovandia affinis]